MSDQDRRDAGWPLPRRDAQNTGRSPLRGRMTGPPVERWRMGTGGDIEFARAVLAEDGDGTLVLAGSVLQRLNARGEVTWRLGTLGASFVQHVGPFDGSGRPCALVRTDPRTLVLVDVAGGEVCWRWEAAPGTFVGDAGGLKVEPIAGPRPGAVLYLFPTYSTEGWCFDFTGDRRSPALRWHVRELPFDAGFGPSVVLADMDADGVRKLFLSSRTGTEYRRNVRAGQTTTAEVVLGRQHGAIWQAVMDPATGRLLDQVRFVAVPGAPHDSARPYGLLDVTPLTPRGRPEAILVSCQVEEYAVLTRRTRRGGLARRDGWFVEKDWPEDHCELRPQPTSVADLRGDGRPMLVIGLWQDGAWRTLLLDPRVGLHDPLAVLPGRYFWGCEDVDGDGVPEIITSREARRGPRSFSTLEAWRGVPPRRIATLQRAAILASATSPLPMDIAFMANRRSAIGIRLGDGRSGVLVRRPGPAEPVIGLWGAAAGGVPRFDMLLEGRWDRADAAGSAIVFGDASGRLQAVAWDGRPIEQEVRVEGRLATPLAWNVGVRPELVVDLAGGSIAGGRPVESGGLADGWAVPGSLPALDVGARSARLVVADDADPDRPSLAIHAAPPGSTPPRRVRLPAPVHIGIVPLAGGRGYAVNLRTGVHTMSLQVRDARGRLAWQDPVKGAYLRPPATDLVDGQPAVVSDDHGELRRYGADGALVWMSDWTAAYTMPIPGQFGPNGDWAVLRAGGIHGLELLDGAGATIWRTDAELWEYASSTPAVGHVGGQRDAALGAVTRAGTFHSIDVATGRLRWSLDLGCRPNGSSIVAADVDGDGADEFVVGLPDGRLVSVGEDDRGSGAIRWTMQFDAAVSNPIVVDLNGDGVAELVVATADGAVRWLA